MKCIDSKEAGSLFAIDGDSVSEAVVRSHLDRCGACSRLSGALRSTAATFDLHPGAEALVTFDEDREQLDPEARAFIERHLAECQSCRAALDGAPRAVPLERRSIPRAPAWALAAGILLAFAAGWGTLEFWNGTSEPGFASSRGIATLTLTTSRGSEAIELPDGVVSLRFEVVLGSTVEKGSFLPVVITSPSREEVFSESVRVEEVNDWGFPILVFPRTLFPRGDSTIRIADSLFSVRSRGP